MPITAIALAGLGSTLASNAIAGASLVGTTITSLAAASGRNRSIAIEISNLFKQNVELTYVGNYKESGVEFTPPQPTIEAGKREACLFAKTSDTACGTVGVMVYRVSAITPSREEKEQTHLAIMWSVLYNYNHYSNMFAVGFIDKIKKDSPIEKDLWHEMYYGSKTWYQRKSADEGRPCSFTSAGVIVVATMSNVGNAVMKVEVKPTDEVMKKFQQAQKS